MSFIHLGNVSHITVATDQQTGLKVVTKTPHIVQTTETMDLKEPRLDQQLRDALTLWTQESDQPPVWVDGDNENLVATLRMQWQIGSRAEWEAKNGPWEHLFAEPAPEQ